MGRRIVGNGGVIGLAVTSVGGGFFTGVIQMTF